MKINIAYPHLSTNLTITADMHAVQRITGLKMLDTFDGKLIDEALYAGHIFQIQGGNDKEGFPMHKSVISDRRKRIILSPGEVGYRKNANKGVRIRRSVRGNIVSGNLAMLNVTLIGDELKGPEIAGLTDKQKIYTHFPKRVTKWARKLGVDKAQLNPKNIQTIANSLGKDLGFKRSKNVKVTRYISPQRIKNKEMRKQRSEMKKKNSEDQKKAFLAKNPTYGKIKL